MRGRRPQLTPIAGGKAAPKVPPLPAHLPKGVTEEWRRLIVDLQDRKLFDPVMTSAVEAYVTAMWLIAESRKAIAEDGAYVRTKGMQPKPHPAIGVLNKNLEIAARLAGEFGITPASRSRKALQQGGAGDDDDDAAALGI